MSNAILAALGERARSILKALETDKKETSVPVAPPDPDALPADPRIAGADASPKEADIKEAGESQPAQAPPGTEDEGASTEGGEASPEDDTDEDEGEGRPVKKGFDEFGDADLDPEEMRSLLKAYGVTPPAEEDKIKAGGVDVEGILEAILQGLESQGAVLSLQIAR